MANVVVVGSQWGDEGKGKIVDWLSEQADIVVRFQGGHNAGHTLVIDGATYKLSLLPSGVVRAGKLSVIGNGVVVDPQALIDEIAQLGKQGVKVTPDNLRIAENATLILPLHQELDALREADGAATRIGTTGRGIGPAYEDKVGRRAIRLYLLFMAAAGIVAGVGVLDGSLILVVGAMALSPDLLPISAAAVGLVERRWALAGRATLTLFVGLGTAVLTAAGATLLLRLFGRIDEGLALADTVLGPSLTEIGPGTVLVALAAGMAGMLAYETAVGQPSGWPSR